MIDVVEVVWNCTFFYVFSIRCNSSRCIVVQCFVDRSIYGKLFDI
jgi:hypothetical protein